MGFQLWNQTNFSHRRGNSSIGFRLEQAAQAILEKVGPEKDCSDQKEVDVAIDALSRAAAQSALSPNLMERVAAGIRTLEARKAR